MDNKDFASADVMVLGALAAPPRNWDRFASGASGDGYSNLRPLGFRKVPRPFYRGVPLRRDHKLLGGLDLIARQCSHYHCLPELHSGLELSTCWSV